MRAINLLKLGLLAGLMLPTTWVEAGEAIPFRGVVEGYYGRPWGTEGRMSLLKFMGEVGMNTFIYGPKDDPYHHGRWRELYPENEAEDFKKLLAEAKKHDIHFYWAIHLGGAFNESEQDYAALYNKLEAMYKLGFRAFAAFFDDFGGPDAERHASICNHIVDDFLNKKGDCAPLIMCPNHYWGTGDDYQYKLGDMLKSEVNIMWTGSWICSDVRGEAVEKITKAFKRPPFIWWNWPVNDYCRTKLLLGRTYGCDPAKYAGFVSNPMENCEANKIALYGVAKWCLDPENFDSEKTWNESFTKLYSKKVAPAMKVFATHNSDQGPNGHGYRREESVGITNWPAELDRILKAIEILKAELPKENPQLYWEIEGWIKAQYYQARIGKLAFELSQAKKESARKKIVAKIIEFKKKQAQAGEQHREKFAKATFSGDKGHIKAPLTATTVLEPMIKQMIADSLKIKTAQPEAISTVKAIKKPIATREGKFIHFQKVMEQTTIAPKEFFGLIVPKTARVNYIHARFDSDKPAEQGRIELSKDFGNTWQAFTTENKGADMQARLKVEDGWNAARYINTSDKPVTLKINQFKFDVDSDDELMLMEEFVK